MKRLFVIFAILMFVMAGCGGEVETAVIPTATLTQPTETSLPPTETAPLPTETALPPTETPISPTSTPLPPTEEPEMVDLAALEEALQAIVDEQVAAGFPGVILLVDAPDMDFSWQGAGGMANAEAGVPMNTDTPFRTASITKMMTAAVMLQLAEEGMIDLDDPISEYLDTAVIEMLEGPEGAPYGEMITIRQLLNHTSGVADFFSPTHVDNTSDEFDVIFVNDPDKVWEPIESIAFATENVTPQFAPGEKWDYSNTNFILAGLIIEEVTGLSLSEAYQIWLITPLGLNDTYFTEVDDPRLEAVSHVYRDDLDMSDYASLSWLWGSGGVVTTVEDLNRFMWAWVNDEIFTAPASKEAMTEWISMSSAGFDDLYYGLGIIDIDFGAMGMPEIGEIIGHNGMWNGFAYYWPKHNLTIIGTLNQANPMDAYTGPVFMTMQTILASLDGEGE